MLQESRRMVSCRLEIILVSAKTMTHMPRMAVLLSVLQTTAVL